MKSANLIILFGHIWKCSVDLKYSVFTPKGQCERCQYYFWKTIFGKRPENNNKIIHITDFLLLHDYLVIVLVWLPNDFFLSVSRMFEIFNSNLIKIESDTLWLFQNDNKLKSDYTEHIHKKDYLRREGFLFLRSTGFLFHSSAALIGLQHWLEHIKTWNTQ
jgi:hypothetical protein